MKYYLIAGEASGDLHASHLMEALKEHDKQAQFRFIGGDLMAKQGGTCVKHYKQLAYMGFIPVLLHLNTILKNMKQCKKDIVSWAPHVVILVDYPGFNLNIAKFLKNKTAIPTYYYIAPKIWAWKEWRIKSIKRNIKELFSILPFEVDFFEKKHHYPIHYVGNPTAHEVSLFQKSYTETRKDFAIRHKLHTDKPIIALLAGSRKQEIKDNLPTMIRAASAFQGYQLVLAGAPSIAFSYYEPYLKGTNVHFVNNQTYALLSHSTAALVTSGTATLETALFCVPQVVCYKTPLGKILRFAFQHIIKVKFISLVNLILNKEAVSELFADKFSEENIIKELKAILPEGHKRSVLLNDYDTLKKLLGNECAPNNAAKIMIEKLTQQTNSNNQ